jgi:glycosyltransferase involved in cell wall biosynthesis
MKTPYFSRMPEFVPRIEVPPPHNLQTVVVIPCYNECNLLDTLQSLHDCVPTQLPVEIIVHINTGENDSTEIITQNRQTLMEASRWVKTHSNNARAYHIITTHDMPKKIAGVGLARKTGMDEAAYRLNSVDNSNGIIVCLDADCLVEKNYLSEIEKHFCSNPEINGCSIYFEHPLTGKEPELVYQAIVNYELYLRYYVHALRYCGFHAPYHTIGSCMVVRNHAYQKQGGMNKRKAGEDFYFLQKLFHLQHFSELNTTTVYPSPRISSRVPFGTGSAVGKLVSSDTNHYTVYHYESFDHLKAFFRAMKAFAAHGTHIHVKQLAQPLQEFLIHQNFDVKIREFTQHSRDSHSFYQRFCYWFDGFMVLKYMHFVRDGYLANIEIVEALKWLFQNNDQVNELSSKLDWLNWMRKTDKQNNS